MFLIARAVLTAAISRNNNVIIHYKLLTATLSGTSAHHINGAIFNVTVCQMHQPLTATVCLAYEPSIAGAPPCHRSAPSWSGCNRDLSAAALRMLDEAAPVKAYACVLNAVLQP